MFSSWIRRKRSAIDLQEDELMALVLDTTSTCNLRCTICSLDKWYKNKGVMTLDTYSRLAKSFSGLHHIALSNSAEPFLNKHLVEMLRIAKEETEGRVAVSLTTNGTLLTESNSRALIENGLDGFQVSLDGATKETFERIRLGARFDTVLENLSRLVSLKEKMNRTNPQLSVRFVLSRENMHELPSTLDLLHGLGIDYLVINGMEAYDEEAEKKILYGEEVPREASRLFEEISLKAGDMGIRLDLPALSPGVIDDCTLVTNSCHILWDGTVVPCSPLGYKRPSHYKGRRALHPRITFGNVNRSSVGEIWNSAAYRRFRANLRKGRLKSYCKSCLYRAGVLSPLDFYNWLTAEGRRS